MDIAGPAELTGTVTKDEFITLLRRVRQNSGLSYRQLEESSRKLSTSGRVAPLSRSTIGDMLTGKLLFDESRLIAFLRTCRVPPKQHPEFIVAWRRILADPDSATAITHDGDVEKIANYLIAIDSLARESLQDIPDEGLAESARNFVRSLLNHLDRAHSFQPEAKLDMSRVLRLGGLDPRLLLYGSAGSQLARHRFVQVLESSNVLSATGSPAVSAASILEQLVIRARSELVRVDVLGFSSNATRLLRALASDSQESKTVGVVRKIETLIPAVASASLEFQLFSDLAAIDLDEEPQHEARTAAILQAAAEQVCQLPPYDPLFTGREEDIAHAVNGIVDLYKSEGCAAAYFSGQPGAGTSGVVIEVARSLRGRFEGRVVYVDMRGLDLSARRSARTAIRLVSKALHLGVRISEHQESDELYSAYLRAASDTDPFVLVLDNAHNYDQIAPMMPVPSGCVTLVSSRERLTGYDTPGVVSRVAPLVRADSINLLKHYFQSLKCTNDDLSALSELCDDLPLALRIVGSRAMSRADLPVTFILRRLQAERSRLNFLTFGERAIRASISLSYDLLNTDEKLAVKGLAVIPGRGVSEMEVQYCLNYPPGRSETILDGIVNKSLAEQTFSMTDEHAIAVLYSVPPLIGDFGVEQAQSDSPPGYRDIQGKSIEFLARRFDLIDGAEPEQDDQGLAISAGIAQYSSIDAQLELNPARAQAAVELAAKTPELDPWVQASLELALCLEKQYLVNCDLPNLLIIQRSEIDLRMRIGERKATISACFHCADRIHELASDDLEAAAAARDYLSLAEELSIGDHSSEMRAKAIFRLSIVYASIKDYEPALRSSIRVMGLLVEAGRKSISLPVLSNIMNLAIELRRYETAIEWYVLHKELVEEFGDSSICADIFFASAWAYGHTDSHDAATTLYKSAAASFAELGQRLSAAISLSNAENHRREAITRVLASTIVNNRNLEIFLEVEAVAAARELIREALSYIQDEGYPVHQARLHIDLSSLSAICGDLKDASEQLDESRNLLLSAEETPETTALTYEVELRRISCNRIRNVGDQANYVSNYSNARGRHGKFFVDFSGAVEVLEISPPLRALTIGQRMKLRTLLMEATITPPVKSTGPTLRDKLGDEAPRDAIAIE